MARIEGVYADYFCGNKISDYGLENGRVDYRTLAESFDCVLANTLHDQLIATGQDYDFENGDIEYREDSDGNRYTSDEAEDKISELEEEQGGLDPYEDADEYRKQYEALQDQIDDLSDEKYNEVFQWFLISESGRQILMDYTDEIVEYFPEYDAIFWGVTHCGTSWDYVLTDIKCNTGKIK